MTSLPYSQRVVSPSASTQAQEWACVFCSYLHTAENNEASFHCCKLCQTARCHYTNQTMTTTRITNTITASPMMAKTDDATPITPSPSSSSHPRDNVEHSPPVLDPVTPVASSKIIPARRPRCLDWDPKELSLEEWIATVRPSQLSAIDCQWIGIEYKVSVSASTSSTTSSGSAGKHRVNPPAYRRALRQITNQIANAVISPTKSRVLAVAKKNKKPQNAVPTSTTSQQDSAAALLGKWMFFVSTRDVDDTWERIARATARGDLGCVAKIAPARTTTTPTPSTKDDRSILSDRPILCCVYVKDFTRRAQVKRVLVMLLKLLGNHTRASFKPDFYGDLDPVLYKKEQVLAWNDAGLE